MKIWLVIGAVMVALHGLSVAAALDSTVLLWSVAMFGFWSGIIGYILCDLLLTRSLEAVYGEGVRDDD